MTTLQQLPGDVLDIIYRKKHELETADIVSCIKMRHDNLMDRCKKLIDNMRKYGKICAFDPEDELELQRYLYTHDIIDHDKFNDILIYLEENSHLIYDVDEPDDVLFDFDYWLGNVHEYEYEFGNYNTAFSIKRLMNRYEDKINEHVIFIDRSSYW